MSPPVFISYRRDDSRWAAGLLFKTLERALGREAVFFDRTTIAPGDEWDARIETAVRQCRVLVVVMGNGWLTAADDHGQLRILKETDWVRRELATALSRIDKPLILPVLLDGAKPPAAELLPPDLRELPRHQGSPVRAIPDFENDVVPVVDRIAAHLGVKPEVYSAAERRAQVVKHSETHDHGNRQRMLSKVHDAWISGFLEKSLGTSDSFALSLEFAPSAVVQSADLTNAPLGDSRNLAEVFEEFDRQLLILGAPGAGKTILLLQLAARLIEEAEQDVDVPIPVILSLSSWAVRRLPFDQWIVEELRLAYQVPVAVGRDWVERKQVLLLLDGLDEVTAEYRPECADAINRHLKAFQPLPVVVCSRKADYEAIGTRLELKAAVILQGLDLPQARAVLAGPEYDGARAVAQQEPEFETMWTVPFLLNLTRVAYRGVKFEKLALPAEMDLAAARRARREHLLGAYVESRLDEADANSTGGRPPFYRRPMKRWLSWLAASMYRRGGTVFYVEALQGSWLPSAPARLAFAIISSVVFGALMGSLGAVAISAIIYFRMAFKPEDNERLTLVNFLPIVLALGSAGAAVFLVGVIGRIAARPLAAEWGGTVRDHWRALGWSGLITAGILWVMAIPYCVLFVWLRSQPDADKILDESITNWQLALVWALVGLGGGIVVPVVLLLFRGVNRLMIRWRWWRSWMAGPAMVLAAYFVEFLIHWIGGTDPWKFRDLADRLASALVIFALLALGRAVGLEIRMVEQLRWRWSWKYFGFGAVWGLAIGWFLENLISLFHIPTWKDTGMAAAGTLVGAVLGGIWGGLHRGEHVALRQHPADGLRRTFRYNAMVTLGFALAGATIVGVGYPLMDWMEGYQFKFTEGIATSVAAGAWGAECWGWSWDYF